jgi:carbonic anhydrase
LEFAVTSLQVQHIVVLGHGRCGGILAALSRNSDYTEPGDFIGHWIELIAPAATAVQNDPDLTPQQHQTALELASVQCSLNNLRSFPTIAKREAEGKIALHGAWFDISEGKLWVFDPEKDQFQQV